MHLIFTPDRQAVYIPIRNSPSPNNSFGDKSSHLMMMRRRRTCCHRWCLLLSRELEKVTKDPLSLTMDICPCFPPVACLASTNIFIDIVGKIPMLSILVSFSPMQLPTKSLGELQATSLWRRHREPSSLLTTRFTHEIPLHQKGKAMILGESTLV